MKNKISKKAFLLSDSLDITKESHCVCVPTQTFCCVPLFETPWTVAFQVPLFMELPKQEYWSGLPFPTPEDLPNPQMEPISLASPALAGGVFTTAPIT